MAIRLSGLTSGLDTDAIVQEMVSAYSLKTEKYEKQQTKLTWKQDAWKNLNTKIYGLYTNVSNLRYSSAYSLKKTTVSDNTKATVTASSEAVTGTQMLNILQTAQASYITGSKLEGDIKSTTKMSELGYTGGNTSLEVLDAKGEKHEIKIKKDSTINEVVAQLKEAGLNANFDENNKRFFISAKDSGIDNDFNLYSNDEDGQEILSLLGLNTTLTTTDKEGKRVFTAAGAAKYQAGLDLYNQAKDAGFVDADGNADVTAYINAKVAEYKDAKAVYETANEKVNNLTKQLDARKAYDEAKAAYDEATTAYTEAETAYNDLAAVDTTSFTEEELKAHEEALAEAKKVMDEKKATLDGYDKTITDYETNYADAIDKTADDLTAELEAAEADRDTKAAYKDLPFAKLAEENDTDEKLGAAVANLTKEAETAWNVLNNPDAAATNGAIKITGQNAIIELNGARFENNSNSFSINGLTVNAQAVTTEGPISITTNVDTQGIYDKVKDFLSEYNTLINEMTKLYNADSARDYEPLTDEEREAMSDEQIEKWENKIKGALLRRDGNLNGVMSAMINAMATSYEINGEKVSLSTFGISTMGYLNAAENENYAYHIDGDEDDENTSGKEDKLMKAIEENPDQILEFMKQLTSGLYSAIDDKMKSTELSSAYKVYNDKEIDRELKNYADIIKKWENKVTEQEEYYYDKFTQMEVALGKLQNQTSSISGLLGMQ